MYVNALVVLRLIGPGCVLLLFPTVLFVLFVSAVVVVVVRVVVSIMVVHAFVVVDA